MKLPDSPAPPALHPASPADSLAALRTVADTLDNLGIAACVFDEADNTLLWNHSFLTFFSEHAAHIHVGEPYRLNLQRFYRGRLSAAEMPDLERYVENGVTRHLDPAAPLRAGAPGRAPASGLQAGARRGPHPHLASTPPRRPAAQHHRRHHRPGGGAGPDVRQRDADRGR